MQPFALLASLLLAFTASTTARGKQPTNSVLLSQIKTLTLRHGQPTTARRLAPIDQLICIGGNAKGLYDVDVMRCQNAGAEYDAEDVQWTCHASLPPEFKLGGTEVVCEGYESPEDPYVLKGSCGVEYRLVLTEAGEEKYGRSSFERAYRHPSGASIGSALFTLLFWGVFVGVICIFIYRVFFGGPQQNGQQFGNGGNLGYNGGGGSGGGGGGGDDGDDQPPPPYTPRAPKPGSSHYANRAVPNYPVGSTPDQQANGSWRPGFWTGAMTAAAAGYAANALRGDRNANRNRGYEYDPPQAGPSNWFGRTRDPPPPTGAYTSPLRAPVYGGGGGGGGASAFGGGGSSSPQASSSRYESTGFGGTRRR